METVVTNHFHSKRKSALVFIRKHQLNLQLSKSDRTILEKEVEYEAHLCITLGYDIAGFSRGVPKFMGETTVELDQKKRITTRNYISKIALNLDCDYSDPYSFGYGFHPKMKKGVIVDNAPPYELTKQIEGMVGNVSCLSI